MIADNKVASDAIIDDVGLQNLINELSEHNVFALDFAFDDSDLSELADRILADAGGYQAEPQDDDIPETVEPITQAGDLWTLGKHRVMAGDSTKAEDVARLMGGVKVDTIFTDPPYNVGRDYGDDTNDNQTPEQYKQWQLSWMKILPVDKDGDIFCTPGLRYCILTANCLSEIYNYVWIIAWEKLNSMMRSATGFNTWEPILWFKNGIAKGYGNHRYDIINCPTVVSKGIDHPTPKNVNLIADLFAIKGDKLKSAYDPFLGSGTTLIACQKLNRICYGMEIDAHYCDVIVKRYVDFVGSSAGVFVTRNGEDIEYEELINERNKQA